MKCGLAILVARTTKVSFSNGASMAGDPGGSLIHSSLWLDGGLETTATTRTLSFFLNDPALPLLHPGLGTVVLE